LEYFEAALQTEVCIWSCLSLSSSFESFLKARF